MRRRDFIVVLSAVTFRCAARAQQPGAQIVGVLESGSHEPFSGAWAAFLQGMREVGYIEGQNCSFEIRTAADQYDRLPGLAKVLVDRHVSVIVAVDVVSAHAAKAATSTIPIVFESGIDPVKDGLVASLNHPGANLTGVSMFAAGLGAKRLELLRAVVPKPKLIGVLLNPNNPNFEVQLSEVRAAAREIGQDLLIVSASAEADFDAAFATFVQRRIDGLIVGSDPMFSRRADSLAALAVRSAIPAIYDWRWMVSAGGLMSYGTNINDSLRQMGIYTGKILKGTKPADLPVVQATKFELVVNLKTAKALGLTIPPSVLVQAHEVIE
ncbi:ABC transporter substrate-binding protein [Bradyrhizobium liaoningense]|uniref:ABC transporter substrate-binding protein n=1 Tax=Bradyrhizobium liaoningense TaxID=43992 RepID=UPI001BA93F3F|nr:ABC transporter substrate-binding protein [Bradyrhizobium liaoningense]MBR0719849.1 ABC transporter substrate-binding protein [Bradyrhizobium liaoningense]